MIALTADDAMLATLSEAQDPVEVKDRTGRLIGYFIPASVEQQEEWYERAQPQVSPAELERRLGEPGRRLATREVLEHLMSLTSHEAARAHDQAGRLQG